MSGKVLVYRMKCNLQPSSRVIGVNYVRVTVPFVVIETVLGSTERSLRSN